MIMYTFLCGNVYERSYCTPSESLSKSTISLLTGGPTESHGMPCSARRWNANVSSVTVCATFLPTYKNKKMMRHHHMYLQRFVPGSWLPLHRERCYGVLTIYLNPDEDWNEQNPAPKFVYYTTQDLHNLETHEHTYDIHCNSGTFFLTEENDPTMNAYHKVEYNESDQSRYALQMFFGPGQQAHGTMTGNIGYRTHEYRNDEAQGKYADMAVDQTQKAIM